MRNAGEKSFNPTVIQQEAINWNEGALLIQGIAGSGKTTVLAKRIERILSESPDDSFRILALAYTKRGKDVIKRLACLPGSSFEKRLDAHTYHSFCTEILKQNGSYVNVHPNFVIYSQDEDLVQIMHDIQLEFDEKRVSISLPFPSWLPLVQDFQRNLVENNRQSIKKYLLRYKKTNYVEAELIFKAYMSQLEQINALDYPSLLYKTYFLFRDHPFVTNLYRNLYRYFCIDELDGAPFAWLSIMKEMTRGKFHNIVAAANDSQSIYAFRNDRRLQLNKVFEEVYGAKVLHFVSNFRCPMEVEFAANRLFGMPPGDQPIPQEGDAAVGHIRVLAFPSLKDELQFIAHDIDQKWEQAPGQSFAVLTRTNRLAEEAYKVLNPAIRARLDRNKARFDSLPLAWFHAVLFLSTLTSSTRHLDAVVDYSEQLFPELNFNTEKIITESMAIEGNLYRVFLQEALTLAERSESQLTLPLFTLLQNFAEGTIDLKKYIEETFRIFDEQSQQDENGLFEHYDAESGIYKEMLMNDQLTLSNVLQETALREDVQDMGLPVIKTVHRAQGEEFDHVYVTGMQEGTFPTSYSLKNEWSLLEDRHICYVAVTRTTNQLTLTMNEKKFPSRFIGDMGLKILKWKDYEASLTKGD